MRFKAVNWSRNEMIGEAKMDTITENAEWLFKNTPRAIYTLPSGLRRQEGVRIAAGRALITRRKSDTARVFVRFGNFFSARTEPLITTGIIAEHQPRIFCVVSGIGQLHPDHQGFQVRVNVAAEQAINDSIARSFFVAWQAVGY